jgi:hypothetical protein
MNNPINTYLNGMYLNTQHIENALPNLHDTGHFDDGFDNAAIDADFIISLGINPFKGSEMSDFIIWLDNNCISLLNYAATETQRYVRLAYEACHSDDKPYENIDWLISNS